MNEIFQKLNAANVRYLLIGGQAMRLQGMPRYSMDWDLFIPPRDQGNVDRINSALAEHLEDPVTILGPKGEGFVQSYQTRYGVLQLHLLVPGVPKFDDAEQRAESRELGSEVAVPCMGCADLLAAKEAANRPQDQQDILYLNELKRLGKF